MSETPRVDYDEAGDVLKVFGVRDLLRRAGFSVLPFGATPPKEAPVGEKSAADHLADCRSHLFEATIGGNLPVNHRTPTLRAVECLLAAVEALEARTRPAAMAQTAPLQAVESSAAQYRLEGLIGCFKVCRFDAAGKPIALLDYTTTSFAHARDVAATFADDAAESRVYHVPSGALLWVRRPAPSPEAKP